MHRMTRSTVWLALIVLPLGMFAACNNAPETAPDPDNRSEDVAYLIEQLNSKNPKQGGLDIRVAAANLLGRQGPAASEAIPHLEKLAKNPDPSVAGAAKNALEKIRGGG